MCLRDIKDVTRVRVSVKFVAKRCKYRHQTFNIIKDDKNVAHFEIKQK